MKAKNPAKKDRRLMVPDTNILWHGSKDVPVSPDFSRFDRDFRQAHNLQLVIPEVVLGELVYQHTSAGLATLNKAIDNLQSLERMTESKYKQPVSEDRIRANIRKKFQSWLAGCSAETAATPIGSIDWARVIQDSVWRIPPFTEDKNTKAEKGFRDALIMETVLHLATSRRGYAIDFISNDGVLRTATKARSRGLHISFFESLENYSSHLRLLDQQLTETFVSAISSRASEKFFSPTGRADLLRTASVLASIKDLFREKLTPPPSAPRSRGAISFLALGNPSGPSWVPETPEQPWIFDASFNRRESDKQYFWTSRVQLIQFFRNQGAASGSLLTELVGHDELRIRKNVFDVIWKANVGSDGRFSKCSVEEIRFVETVFRPPTADEMDRYGTPMQTRLGDIVTTN